MLLQGHQEMGCSFFQRFRIVLDRTREPDIFLRQLGLWRRTLAGLQQTTCAQQRGFMVHDVHKFGERFSCLRANFFWLARQGHWWFFGQRLRS